MLSPEQQKQRQGKLTASRVAVLMNGVAEDVLRLYMEMIGEEQEEDLSGVWAVQLGIATEQLNLDWIERKGGVPITRRGEVVVHSQYSWAACTLDGFADGFCVEAKHVGGREPLEVVISRYQPQCQWQMFVTNTTQCVLSVIVGVNEPIVEYIDRDDDYIAEMVKRGKKFMTCVAARLPPVILPAVPPPVPHDSMIEVDMTADATWKKSADIWLQTYGAKKSATDAEKVLKELVADNVRKAWGNGVRITRDKAGRLSLREDK
jgi:hypothetical protein